MLPLSFPSNYYIAFPEGRFGNAIFHYLALTNLSERHTIYTNYFNLYVGITLPMRNRYLSLLTRFLERIGKERSLAIARYTHLFSIATIDLHIQRQLIFQQNGLFPITLLDVKHTTDTALLPRLSLINPQQLIPSNHLGTPCNRSVESSSIDMYFLHVRRTDYVSWPSRSKPAVLPLLWYTQTIDLIRSCDSSARFLVFSDDIPYCQDFFKDSDLFVFSYLHTDNDFLAMTRCSRGGILSASTYSLIASYYGHMSYPDARYYAPLYWYGWPQDEWLPSLSIRADHTSYIHV